MIKTNKNKQDILAEIINLEKSCGSIIDAILQVCTLYEIEIETMSQYIRHSKEIKERIQEEGQSLRLLKV